jgi:hypothetical protein
MKQNHVTLGWVRKQIELHRSKLADYEATERVMLSAKATEPSQGGSDALPLIPSATPPVSAARSTSSGTKKLVMLRLIAEATNGRTTREVIDKMIAGGDEGRNTRNTSPQLSGMRKGGLLTVNDGLWLITKAGREYISSAKE